MGKQIICNYCKGSGTVTAWNAKKKTYEEVTCTACRGKGVVDSGNF